MEQVADWLEKLGLGQYAQRFAENDIDFALVVNARNSRAHTIPTISLVPMTVPSAASRCQFVPDTQNGADPSFQVPSDPPHPRSAAKARLMAATLAEHPRHDQGSRGRVLAFLRGFFRPLLRQEFL
jgi:hypothetical protein